MAKINVDLSAALQGDDDAKVAKKAKELAAPLPSPHRAAATAARRAPRVQLSFTNVPEPVKEAFAAEAAKRRIGMKQLLYALMRDGGIDIPSDVELDGRRRD